MKRMSQIAKELRAKGRMFSQTSLRKDLSKFTPVFQEGKVIFYEDTVVEALMGKYMVRAPYIGATPVEVSAQDNQLDKIQKMLEAICKAFDLEVAQ